MRRLTTLLLMLLALLPAQASGEVGPTLPVDELVRGMMGVGRTVFQGTQIDTFSAEILGVLRNVESPGRNLILARLSGGPLAETGVIQGMSGSPVYVDGKLIGAVGWGWTFSKQAIAGITPIGEMLETMRRSPSAAGSTGWTGRGDREPDWATTARTDEGLQKSDALLEDFSRMRRIAVPLVASGYASEALAQLSQDLQPFGLMPVQSGGGTDTSLTKGAFEPGAAMGAQLMRGDYSITGIGTLTYREGDRVVGFGHPMFWSGTTEMPMTSAYIHGILPNLNTSFKLGAASGPLGAIVEDRAAGVVGILGQRPRMVPLTIAVSSAQASETFHMEVVRDRDWAPLLVQSAVTNTLMTAEKAIGDATVRMRTKVEVVGYPPLEVENLYSGRVGLGLAALGAAEPVRYLAQNQFAEVDIRSVSVELEVEEHTRTARIESIRLSRSQFEPGDTAHVEITLRPHLDTRKVVEASVVIPQGAREGRLLLRVSGGSVYRSNESKRAPGEYEPHSVDELMKILRELERSDTMVVELLSPSPGVTVGGREMGSLPPSVRAALKQSRTSQEVRPVSQSVVDLQRIPTDYVLAGSETVYLNVGKEGDGLIFDGKGPSGDEKTERR